MNRLAAFVAPPLPAPRFTHTLNPPSARRLEHVIETVAVVLTAALAVTSTDPKATVVTVKLQFCASAGDKKPQADKITPAIAATIEREYDFICKSPVRSRPGRRLAAH